MIVQKIIKKSKYLFEKIEFIYIRTFSFKLILNLFLLYLSILFIVDFPLILVQMMVQKVFIYLLMQVLLKMSSKLSKIDVSKPIVELDGDEMTRGLSR